MATRDWKGTVKTGANTIGPFTVDANNQVINPTQPAFIATLGSGVANQTGDGTAYTIICNTEIKDQNADYNTTTGIFTAPVAGLYQCSGIVQLNGLAVGNTTCYFELVTSNRTYELFYCNLVGALGTVVMLTGSMLCDMDAADTAFLRITVDGGTKVVDIETGTKFTGFLAC